MLARAGWLALVISLFAAPAAMAVTLWDNGGPNFLNGAYADRDVGGQQMGDSFTASAIWSVTRIVFSGGYLSNPSSNLDDDFYFRIFAKTGGAPSATPLYEVAMNVPATFAAALILGSPGAYSYHYTADIPAAVLAPGDYLLAITRYDAAGFPSPYDYWIWNGNTFVGDAFVRHADGAAWTATTAGELAFRLEGTAVPAPGALALLGSALPLFAIGRRRG
jgi:hypothetical protein